MAKESNSFTPKPKKNGRARKSMSKIKGSKTYTKVYRGQGRGQPNILCVRYSDNLVYSN